MFQPLFGNYSTGFSGNAALVISQVFGYQPPQFQYFKDFVGIPGIIDDSLDHVGTSALGDGFFTAQTFDVNGSEIDVLPFMNPYQPDTFPWDQLFTFA